jgi:NAD+ kinase
MDTAAGAVVQNGNLTAVAKSMACAGIFIKRKDKRAGQLAAEIIDWLAARGWGCLYEIESYEEVRRPGGTHKTDMAAACDLIVVLGGDGTMLAAARALAGRDVPILGCNLGSLGFLTEIAADELFPTLEAFLAGRVVISRRMMLRVIRHDGEGKAGETYSVLNDVVVGKSALARILDLEVWVDREFVNAYKADGLIVATPTGSTAYSLAAGGPLVHPTLPAIVLTPLAPHTLTARSIVIPPECLVEVKLTSSNAEAYITLDGQEGFPFHVGDVLDVGRAAQEIAVVTNPRRTFYDISRTKLKWGER